MSKYKKRLHFLGNEKEQRAFRIMRTKIHWIHI